jgi:KDO2-lipid IV(A) lauroyltransferase
MHMQIALHRPLCKCVLDIVGKPLQIRRDMARKVSADALTAGNLLAAAGIRLLRLSALLPLSSLQAIGRAVGRTAYQTAPFRCNVAAANLRTCFPALSPQQLRSLLRRHYEAMGMGMFELGAGWYQPWQRLRPYSVVHGLEHIDAVRASGRGALMLTAHFTTLEICGRILNEHRQFSCLYRRPNQPRIAAEMMRARAGAMHRTIHREKMNELIRALREGEFVWYAPDQGLSSKYSELLPFFGVPAITNTATGRIANMGKAAILPFFGYRAADGRYHVEILPEQDNLPSDDPLADALHVNQIIERFIQRAPDQYFWLHRRFKGRGPDLPDVYRHHKQFP